MSLAVLKSQSSKTDSKRVRTRHFESSEAAFVLPFSPFSAAEKRRRRKNQPSVTVHSGRIAAKLQNTKTAKRKLPTEKLTLDSLLPSLSTVLVFRPP